MDPKFKFFFTKQRMEDPGMQGWDQGCNLCLDLGNVHCHVVCVWAMHHLDNSCFLWSHHIGRLLPDLNMLAWRVHDSVERISNWGYLGACGCQVDSLVFFWGLTSVVAHMHWLQCK